MDQLAQNLLDIVKYILPSLVVFGVCYVLISKMMEDNASRIQLEMRKKTASLMTPLKLQAYERMILFLERISPQNLIKQYNDGTLSTVYGLKHLMEASVNQEFSHNLSQQIYISNQGWNIVKVVKEEVIQLLHNTADTMPENSTGLDFSKAIIDRMIAENKIPTQKAIDFLKAEINLYF
ncbi:MAG: hypothetical protein HQ463_08530 [Bacteroidetes bacterium]|nr:hypothetical protein [Bacteroidota bacterium]